MTKQEFIKELREKLSDLPKSELEDRLGFYIEMIEDGIEEGKTEEEAVAEIGGAEIVCARIREELSGAECNDEEKFETVAESKELAQSNEIAVLPTAEKKSGLSKTASILIFWIGSPIWLALAITLYAVLWSVVVSLYAVNLSLAASTLAIVFVPVLLVKGRFLSALLTLGAVLFVAGLAIFTFFLSKQVTLLMFKLSKKILLAVKASLLKRKEEGK